MKKRFVFVSAAILCLSLVLTAFAACGQKESGEAKPEESGPDQALIDRYRGDWNGCVEFQEGTGKYETLTGTVAAIARLNVEKDGAITPFIGLFVEDTPIEDLTARFDGEDILISGKWISADFKDVPLTEKNGTLSTRISVSKEAGSVSLAFNFRRLNDTGWTDEEPGFSESQIEYCMGKSFDELAQLIGYQKSDYPEALDAAAASEAPAESAPGAIIGSWEYVNGGYTYTFNADGTGSYAVSGTVMEFTYEDTGSKVSILFKGNTLPSEYAYTVSGDLLSIEDSFGDKVEYKKK